MKEYWQKYTGNFKGKPLKLIGTIITYLGIALIVVPALLANIGLFPNINIPTEVFYAFFIMVIVGPFLLIISWTIYRELIKEGPKMWIIGIGWLLISVFGIGHWLANIMLYTSLGLIAIGIILSIINILKYNRFTGKKPE